MIEEFLNSLKELWGRIERLEEEIDSDLENQIRYYIGDKLKLPEIIFERKFSSFERITINKKLSGNNNDRIVKIRYLYNPPPQFVNSYGRANLKNQAIFYATFLTPIAIKELKPDVGDIYTLSIWKLLNSYDKLIVYPIFQPKQVGKSEIFRSLDIFEKTRSDELSIMLDDLLENCPEEEKKVVTELLKFIANCFAKNIAPNHNSLYVFTASLANKIFDLLEGRIEAITYPTVQDPTQIENIALKPTVVREKYALVEVREYKVLRYSGDQIMSEYLGKSNKFIGGNIIWD